MSSVEFLPSFLKIFSALAVVVGLILLSMYVIRVVMKKTGGKYSNRDFIKILATKYLGTKSSIVLVDVLGSIMVIGLSQQQISILAKIDDAQSLERLKDFHGENPLSSSFSDHLMLCKSKLSSLCNISEKESK